MNALSKVSARVKLVAVLVAGVFVVAVGSTMINASLAEPEIEISFSHYTTNQNARFAIVEIEYRRLPRSIVVIRKKVRRQTWCIGITRANGRGGFCGVAPD